MIFQLNMVYMLYTKQDFQICFSVSQLVAMYHNNPNLYNYHLKYSSLIIILSVPSYWIQKYPKETNNNNNHSNYNNNNNNNNNINNCKE